MKPKHSHARKIGAFRSSGHNPRLTPQARSQQPQQPVRDDEGPRSHVISLGPAPTLQAPALRGDGVFITLNGQQWRLPAGIAVAFAQAADGRDLAFTLEKSGRVRILVGTADGVRELVGVPRPYLERIRREKFEQ